MSEVIGNIGLMMSVGGLVLLLILAYYFLSRPRISTDNELLGGMKPKKENYIYICSIYHDEVIAQVRKSNDFLKEVGIILPVDITLTQYELTRVCFLDMEGKIVPKLVPGNEYDVVFCFPKGDIHNQTPSWEIKSSFPLTYHLWSKGVLKIVEDTADPYFHKFIFVKSV